MHGHALVLAAALLAAPVAGAGEPTAQAPIAAAPEDNAAPIPAEAVDALHVPNARRPAPEMLTGGQITPEQMTALRDLGYRVFVNLRPADEPETGWEEEFAAREGIAFARIPVAGAAGVTRENAERLAAVLAEAGGPAVVYCGSGNRAGALLALKARFLEGESAEEALAFGKEAGLTRLEPAVRELLGLPPQP